MWRRRALAAGTTAMVAAVFLTGWSLARNGIFSHGQSRDFRWQVTLYRERLALARWADAHLPGHMVLAAWNAGILGYCANRTLIDLDGLVNEAFFREVPGARRTGALPRYLREHGVSPILDRTLYDYRLPDFVKVPLPEGFAQIQAYRRRDARIDVGSLKGPTQGTDGLGADIFRRGSTVVDGSDGSRPWIPTGSRMPGCRVAARARLRSSAGATSTQKVTRSKPKDDQQGRNPAIMRSPIAVAGLGRSGIGSAAERCRNQVCWGMEVHQFTAIACSLTSNHPAGAPSCR